MSRLASCRSRGFTLVECLVVLALLSLLALTAVPALAALFDARQLDQAARSLAADLQAARAEAISRGTVVRVSHLTAAGGGTCYALHTGPRNACRCDAHSGALCDNEQLIRGVAWPASHGLQVQTNAATLLFDPLHGTATPAGTWRVSNRQGQSVHLVVNLMGRVRSCSPESAVRGHAPC